MGSNSTEECSDLNAAYPLVSCCSVRQGSGGGLAGRGVDLTVLQHTVVQAHNLGVPQPLQPLWLSGHLGERGQVLVVSL